MLLRSLIIIYSTNGALGSEIEEIRARKKGRYLLTRLLAMTNLSRPTTVNHICLHELRNNATHITSLLYFVIHSHDFSGWTLNIINK